MITKAVGRRIASSLIAATISSGAIVGGAIAQTAANTSPDVQHIALDLHFDTVKRRASGAALISLKPISATRQIALDATALDITSVEIVGVGQTPFSYQEGRAGGALIIDLGRTYGPSEQVSLRIVYSTQSGNETDPANIWGSVGEGLRFHGPSTTDPRRRVQVWSSNLPGSNPRWFPGHDDLVDLRSFELTATVAPGLTVLSNGALVAETTNADGSKTFHWRLDRPQQNHRSSVVIGAYVNAPLYADGIVLNNYGYPDEMTGVRASVERLPDMVVFMTNLIGTPLPFPSYSQAFVQELPWGMANAGLATMTENFVDSAEVHRDFLYLWDDLEAESLAEQWFGNAVAPATWEDAWLSRGLPRYLATLYNEHRNGEAEILLSPYHVGGDLQTVLSDWNGGVREAVAPDNVEDPAAFVLGNTTYIRAGMVLRLLEGEIGRDRLVQAIRVFAQRAAQGLATTADFEAAVSRAAGRDMAWFFDQWMERADHPVLTVSKTFDAREGKLIIQVDQTLAEGSAGASRYFRGAMDVEIDGRIERIVLSPQARNQFAFDQVSEPRFVNFDYKSRWIAEIVFPQDTEELIQIAQASTDVLAQRRALIALAATALSADTPAGQQARIVGLYRDIMEGTAYWRLKTTAIAQLQRVMSQEGKAPRGGLDAETEAALVRIALGSNRDEAWVRFGALNWLGESRNPDHVDLYLGLLRDPSDRVINAAALALGKTGDQRAFDALMALEPHPSWKNQSRISALSGLAELGEPRGAELAMRSLRDLNGARWTLLTPVWDYRLTAAHTLRRLGRGHEGYPFIRRMFDQALAEGQISDAMYNLHLMVALADPRAREAVSAMRARYADDADVIGALDGVSVQLEGALESTER